MLTLTNRIDMRPGAVPLVIHLGQYDSDFSLVFELYSSAGNFTVESGTTAMIRGTKTDGNAYDADAALDISAKTVTVAGSEQMTAAKGRNVYELVLTKSGKVLSTANFILDVERAAMDADTIASESVLKELNAIIAGATTATEAAADAASAADRAEDAADSVSSASAQIATNTADISDLKEDLSELEHDVKFKTGLYGAKWDRTTNLLTRTRDAVGITTDTTNFAHKGSINSNYSNPFDKIYPWSEMRVVDIDLDMYRSGNYTLKQCIIAVAGDPDFTYEGSNNVFVGRYVPEFWHTKIADESGDEYLISQFARKGYKHVDEYVRGISFAINDGNGGLTSGSGIPLTDIAVSAIHTRAKNSGFTVMDIDTLDAEIMLYLVEFANTNSQNVLGDGCSNCYRENDVYAISNVVVGDGVTTFDITDSAEVQYMHIGAQMDIGATRGAVTYRGIIKAFGIDGSTEHITLDRELAVTDGMIASIHGFSACEFNLTEQNIGSMSGYIGTNGKNNAWYRGALLYGNRYSYILGIYRQTGTNHIWLCPADKDPDDYDALNTSVHEDSGTALPNLASSAWQTVGGNAQNIDGLSAFMATGESSGSSSSPVGDQQYVTVISAGNTILLFGCLALYGWNCGVFGCNWYLTSGHSFWGYAALPILKNPL